jgi:ADP-heptose:LPS heptosyltransferase
LLLVGEPDFRDQIQFLRYANEISRRGAIVDVLVSPELASIAATVPGVRRALTSASATDRGWDFWCYLMSVPDRLGFSLEDIGSLVPDFRVDPSMVRVMGERLGRQQGIRVGLVWAGNPRKRQRLANLTVRSRSIPLRAMSPLFAVPGVEWFSLQVGEQSAHETSDKRPPSAMAGVKDLLDTAAVMANMDLIVSVDSSPAHLAGALGKKVWLLSRSDNGWRWLLDRDDSPRYPSMRMYRQARAFDWDPVIERVPADLRQFVEST